MGACLLAAGAACVGGSKGLSADEKEKLKPYILEAAPEGMPPNYDINFENKVHLVGYKTDPPIGKPGSDIKLSYYWRCDDTLEEGWKLFTHIQDDANDASIGNLDGNGALREDKNGHQILGPDRWEKGKYYLDEQTFKVPDNVKGATFSVLVGVWKGDARLRIISGPTDGDNRAIVVKVKTGLTPAKEEHTEALPPSLVVNKLAANVKITIDGKGDDPAWGGAASTGPFVDVSTGKPNTTFPVNGTAKLAYDDQNVYVLFEVKEPEFYTGFTDAKAQPNDFTTTGQPKLWTKDTVEMMVDPDGDGDNKDYYELQINPQNRIFHAQFDTLQQPAGGPNGPFGHEDWDPKLKSAVLATPGTGYTVEAAIPWAAYAKAQNHPPKPGDTWRVNFYAMKNNGGVAWSPILGQGNFHKASRFGKVTWSVPGAPVAADAAAAPAALNAGDAATMAAPMIPPPMFGPRGHPVPPWGMRGGPPPPQ